MFIYLLIEIIEYKDGLDSSIMLDIIVIRNNYV